MGQTAENLARLKGVSREEMDEFGVRSQNLAEKANADGFWAREITPVTTPSGRVVDADDSPRPGVTIEGVAGLKPVFRLDGRVTAGNACPLNDGAAAVGHPFGMTGARITTTLLNSLASHDRSIGLETMCVGGGQGMAMVLERLR